MATMEDHVDAVVSAYGERGVPVHVKHHGSDSSDDWAQLVFYAEGFHWRLSIYDWSRDDRPCIEHDEFRNDKNWFGMGVQETPEETARLLVEPSIEIIRKYKEWSKDHYAEKGPNVPVFERDWLIREGGAEKCRIVDGRLLKEKEKGKKRMKWRSCVDTRYKDVECDTTMDRKFEYLINKLEGAIEKGDKLQAQEVVDDLWEAHVRISLMHTENYAEIGWNHSKEVWTRFKCKSAAEGFEETEYEWTVFSESSLPTPASPGMVRVRKVGEDDGGGRWHVSVTNGLRRELTTKELIEHLETDE